MISPNITANLDYLASLGVLDYDAAADIAGASPRYVGHPQYYVNPVVMTPMDSVSFSQSANGGSSFSNRPLWKNLLYGALALGGLYFGGKVFLKVAESIKSISPSKWFSRGRRAAEDLGSGIRDGARNIAQRAGLIKKPWYKRAGESISDGFKNVKNIFSRNKFKIPLRG